MKAFCSFLPLFVSFFSDRNLAFIIFNISTSLIIPLLCNQSPLTVILYHHLLPSTDALLTVLASSTPYFQSPLTLCGFSGFLAHAHIACPVLCLVILLTRSDCARTLPLLPGRSPAPLAGPHSRLSVSLRLWNSALGYPPHAPFPPTPSHAAPTSSAACSHSSHCWDSNILFLATLSIWVFPFCIHALTPSAGVILPSTGGHPFHPAYAPFPLHESLTHPAQTPASPPPNRDACLALPLLMAFVLNYLLKGREWNGKEEPAYFMGTVWSKFMFDRSKSSSALVVDLENLERAFGNLLLELC